MGPKLWGYVVAELAHGTNRRYTFEWGPASLGTDAWSAVRSRSSLPRYWV